jgi:hypothetical protein
LIYSSANDRPLVTSRQPIDFQTNRSKKSPKFTQERVFTDGTN